MTMATLLRGTTLLTPTSLTEMLPLSMLSTTLETLVDLTGRILHFNASRTSSFLPVRSTKVFNGVVDTIESGCISVRDVGVNSVVPLSKSGTNENKSGIFKWREIPLGKRVWIWMVLLI